MLYDYRSEEEIQSIVAECFCPIVEDIIDEYMNLRRTDFLAVLAPAWVAEILLTRIIEEEDTMYIDEDITQEELDELLCCEDNEVLISVGPDGWVYIEDARDEEGNLIEIISSLCYIYDGFSHKDVLDVLEDNPSILIFGVEDEDMFFEDDNDEEEIEVKNDDKDNVEVFFKDDHGVHGFYKKRTMDDGYVEHYFRSSYTLSDKVLDKIMHVIY